LSSGNIYDNQVELFNGHNPAVNALLTLQRRMRAGTEHNIRALYPDLGLNETPALLPGGRGGERHCEGGNSGMFRLHVDAERPAYDPAVIGP
jgi:hypothetical protein